MDDYLSDNISTRLGGNLESAYAVLAKAKEDKVRLGNLFERILNESDFSRSEFVDSSPLTLVSSSGISMNLRSLKLSFEDFYRRANELSNTLDTESTTLMAEISFLEKQVQRIEKAISKHAFLIADGGAYNYGYVEAFSDNFGRDTNLQDSIPDRTGVPFSREEEATVDSASGTLIMPIVDSLGRAYSAHLVSDNFSPYMTSHINLDNIGSTDEGQVWRSAINSPIPINSSLREFDDKGILSQSGAKAVIDLVFDSATAINNLYITPLADSSMTLAQITIFGKDDSDTQLDLLNSEMEINAVTHITFNPIVASKVRFYVSQKQYGRTLKSPDVSEEYYKNNGALRNRGPIARSHTYNISEEAKGMYRLFVKNFIRDTKKLGKIAVVSHTSTNREFTWGALNPLDDMNRSSGHITTYPQWFKKPPFKDALKNLHRYRASGDEISPIVAPKINETTRRRTPNYSYLEAEARNRQNRNVQIGAFRNSSSLSAYGAVDENIDESPLRSGYRYVIGLASVVIGVDKPLSRGVFLSKQLSPDGYVGEVLLRDSRSDGHAYVDTLLDNDITSSVEYSVTNNAAPIEEESWTPILPYNNTTVESELLIVGDKGVAKLRFPADPQANISVFRNGKKAYVDNSSLVYSDDYSTILGVNLNAIMVSPVDIYTVAYTPLLEKSSVSFNTSDVPLTTAFDDDGAGEGYSYSRNPLRVKLLNTPYVDYSEVDKSTYTSTLGLAPYQPIVVSFSDGTNAINLTNYINGDQPELDPYSQSYSYIHRGKELVFNKSVIKDFRVYYKYLANNTRVRVILRSHSLDTFSTPRIDYYQIKAKTIKPNIKDRI